MERLAGACLLCRLGRIVAATQTGRKETEASVSRRRQTREHHACPTKLHRRDGAPPDRQGPARGFRSANDRLYRDGPGSAVNDPNPRAWHVRVHHVADARPAFFARCRHSCWRKNPRRVRKVIVPWASQAAAAGCRRTPGSRNGCLPFGHSRPCQTPPDPSSGNPRPGVRCR